VAPVAVVDRRWSVGQNVDMTDDPGAEKKETRKNKKEKKQ